MPDLQTSATVEMRVGGNVRDLTPLVKSFVWIESMIRGGWYWTLDFDAAVWSDWRDMFVGRDVRPDRYLKLRTSGEQSDNSTEWRKFRLDGSKMAVSGGTLVAQVMGGDLRLDMLQKTRTRAWPASKVSDILQRIAGEYGLRSEIQDTTRGRDRWQVRQSDWGYARALASEAAAATGRGDTYLWLDHDTLRFGAPDLAAAAERRYRLDTDDARLDRVLMTYNGREVDRSGGATLRGVGFDLDAGSAITFDMDAPAAATHPALGGRIARAPEDGLRVVATTSESSAGVEECVRSVWGERAPRYFSLRGDGEGDITLRPGKVIEVQGDNSPERDIHVFGRYVALEVMHILTGGSMKTTVIGYRREAFRGESEPTGAIVTKGGSKDRFVPGAAPDQPRTTLVAEVLD